MTTITVSLDTSNDPAVTCEPKHQGITNRGNNSIKWQPGGSQSFTFSSLTGLPDLPFSDLTITDDEITVIDDNQGISDYTYTLTVISNGVPYSTDKTTGTGDGDPSINNK